MTGVSRRTSRAGRSIRGVPARMIHEERVTDGNRGGTDVPRLSVDALERTGEAAGTVPEVLGGDLHTPEGDAREEETEDDQPIEARDVRENAADPCAEQLPPAEQEGVQPHNGAAILRRLLGERGEEGERGGRETAGDDDADPDRGQERDERAAPGRGERLRVLSQPVDRKSTRLNSSHANISYAVF